MELSVSPMFDIIGHQNVPPRMTFLSTVVIWRFGRIVSAIIFLGCLGCWWRLASTSLQFRLPRYGAPTFTLFGREWQHNFRADRWWCQWWRWWHRRWHFRIAAHANAREFIVSKIRKFWWTVVIGIIVITNLFGVTFFWCHRSFIWRIFVLYAMPNVWRVFVIWLFSMVFFFIWFRSRIGFWVERDGKDDGKSYAKRINKNY